jgi:hypothetical protein
MYSCSYSDNIVVSLIGFSNVMVQKSIGLYWRFSFRMCFANADSGFVCCISLICSHHLSFRLHLVCPMYDILHALHVSLYIPLLSSSDVLSTVFGFVSCSKVPVCLKGIATFVCCNKLVIFSTFRLQYVSSVRVLCFFLLLFHPVCFVFRSIDL